MNATKEAFNPRILEISAEQIQQLASFRKCDSDESQKQRLLEYSLELANNPAIQGIVINKFQLMTSGERGLSEAGKMYREILKEIEDVEVLNKAGRNKPCVTKVNEWYGPLMVQVAVETIWHSLMKKGSNNILTS